MSATLRVAKEDFKFNAAHFVLHEGSRELLHGHNFTVEVTVAGRIDPATGYVVDFGVIKKVVRGLCRSLNERFLCPTRTPYAVVTETATNVEMRLLRDGAFFSFPKTDVVLLPLANITSEELARHLLRRVVDEMAPAGALAGVTRVALAVMETPGQAAEVAIDLPETPTAAAGTVAGAAVAAAAAGLRCGCGSATAATSAAAVPAAADACGASGAGGGAAAGKTQ